MVKGCFFLLASPDLSAMAVDWVIYYDLFYLPPQITAKNWWIYDMNTNK